MSERHRVVIVGGGFAGLGTAQALRKDDVQVALIDRRNFHLFQPLLYQVATGALSPANIAAPLRAVLKKHSNCRVLLAEVTGFDVAGKCVLLGDERVAYDTLVIAAGAGNNYFGKPEWERHAPGLKSIEEATEIRRRILSAFEAAERLGDKSPRDAFLTFVVVGGGATGVEMAGAISELARHSMRHDFRTLDPGAARIVLVEGHDRILPPFPEVLSRKAEAAIKRMGIEVWTAAKVKDIQADHVVVERGGTVHRIETKTVVWGAGVKASPLGQLIGDATGATIDRGGRVEVGPDLTVAGHPEIFVIGDLAAVTSGGKPVPGVAPAAMQEGKYVATAIRYRLAGRAADPFHYWDKGSMATIGRNAAVAHAGWINLSGRLAWLAWLFVHIMYLVTFSNRVLVLIQWFANYLTRNRSARLITGERAAADRP